MTDSNLPTRHNGIAFCGVTGSGKSTLTELIGARLARGSLAVLRNNLIQNPGLAIARRTGQVGLQEFLLKQAERCCHVVDLLDGMGYLVCESYGVNALAECGFWDREFYTRLDDIRVKADILLVRLDIAEDEVLERSVLSTRLHRRPGWISYLESLAPDVIGQAEVFKRRRAFVNQYFEWSAEPKVSVATSAMNWIQIADRLMATLRGEEA